MENKLQSHVGNVMDLDDELVIAFNPAAELLRNHSFAMKRDHTFFFETDVNGDQMWEAYLQGFNTPQARQYHNCSCCRRFFTKFAGLVVVDAETFKTKSGVFPQDLSSIHPEFASGFARMRDLAEGARIKRVFYGTTPTLGEGYVGDWEHFYLHQLSGPGRNTAKTPGQNMAESIQNNSVLRQGINAFKIRLFESALGIFREDAQLKCYPSHAENLEWAIELQTWKEKTQDRRLIDNRYWFETAKQPMGRLRIGTTVMGNYLETLSTGKSNEAKANFIKQVDPKDYMRPKAPPSAGNVAYAESVIEKLGAQRSLLRRSLRRDEITVRLWEPKVKVQAATEGVFGHLATKGETKEADEQISVNGGNITLTSFIRRILPTAEKIEVYIPRTSKNIVSFATATDPEAPNILRWDNTVSSYGFINAVPAELWVLRPNAYVEVACITKHPDDWSNPHMPESAPLVMVLTEGHDTGSTSSAIFPETLKPEFHAIRSTIEAYSNSRPLDNKEQGFAAWSVNGAPTTLRVTSNGGRQVTTVVIDRLE